jgi:hypothetical protein
MYIGTSVQSRSDAISMLNDDDGFLETGKREKPVTTVVEQVDLFI